MPDLQLYNLTNSQKVIGYASALYPHGAVNNIGGSLLIEDDLDFTLLEKTLHLCIDRNDSLRLRFVNSASGASIIEQYFMLNSVQQYVTDEPHGEIGFIDFTGKTREEMNAVFLEMNRKPIDIFNNPMYEFTMIKAPDGRCGIFSKIDHMATDAWMTMMLCKEVIDVYYALKNGKELPPPANSYIKYIESEARYLESEKFKKDEEFWLELYREKFTPTDLATEYTSVTGATSRKTCTIDKETTAAIRSFCEKYNISPASLFNTALGILLCRTTGLTEAFFGSTCILRSTKEEKQTCGPLVNNMTMRLKFDENMPFDEACVQSATKQLRMLMHMRYPQLHLMMNVFMMHETQHIFDTIIGYQIARIRPRENVKFQTEWYTSGSFAIPLYISITDLDDAGEYLIYYEFQTECHTPERIDEIHRELTDIVTKGISEPGTKLKAL